MCIENSRFSSLEFLACVCDENDAFMSTAPEDSLLA
jgi:hypothetical protein